MKTYPAKSSQYNTVNTQSIIRYISEYSEQINAALKDGRLDTMDRSQIKAIAAELETACERINR